MFEDLISELEKMDGRQVSVPISSDGEGYFDRACPSETCLFEFKIQEDDWKEKVRDEEVFCPFCRHSADSDQWWTETQIEHAQQAALGQVVKGINKAMKQDVDKWNCCQPRKSFIRMTMKVEDRPTHISLPPSAAEPMELKITCPECACRYAVIGAAYFCPACGHNAVEQDFTRSLQTLLDTMSALPQISEAIGDKGAAQNTTRLIIESGLIIGVTAFQRYAEALYGRDLGAPQARRNVFQNLAEGGALWEQAFEKSFEDHLGVESIKTLNRYFQQRHLLAHKDGIVDDNHIVRSKDTSYKTGQRIVVKEENARECLELIKQLACALDGDALSTNE